MTMHSAFVLLSAAVTAAIGIAALVLRRGRSDAVWFGIGAMVSAAWLFAVGSVEVSPTTAVAWERAHVAAFLTFVSVVPWALATLLFAREGRAELFRRWRPGVVAVAAASAWFGFAALAERVVLGVGVAGSSYALLLTREGRWGAVFLIGAVVFMLFNLEATARCAGRRALHRVRYALLGLAAVLVYALFLLSSAVLYSVVRVDYLTASGAPFLAAGALVVYSVGRRRLGDVGVRVGRPLIVSSLTVFLAGVYLLVLGVISWTASARGWGGPVHVTVALVFLSLLLLAAFVTSSTVRRHIRRFVDSNFYVSRYDHRREWDRTSRALGGGASEEEIVERLAGLLEETFDSPAVAVAAVRTGTPARVGPTSCLGSADARLLTRALLDVLDSGRPVHLSRALSDESLQHLSEEALAVIRTRGFEIAAPLTAAGRVVGVAFVGGRPGRYTREDTDLLKAICSQAGSALLATRLATRVTAGREMERLHRMSSFVLHDLKNTVSGLSLTLDNARRHMGDAAFQEELLEALASSVRAMEETISRLSDRSDDERESGRHRLLDVIEEARARSGLTGADGVDVVVDVGAALAVGGPRPAYVRVFENLLVNAAEAMAGSGRVRIEALAEDGDAAASGGKAGAVIVRIADTGPGVEPCAGGARLFDPFSTTKENGLGLGLFECRELLSECGGSIEFIESAVGATFEVRLPRAGA